MLLFPDVVFTQRSETALHMQALLPAKELRDLKVQYVTPIVVRYRMKLCF